MTEKSEIEFELHIFASKSILVSKNYIKYLILKEKSLFLDKGNHLNPRNLLL